MPIEVINSRIERGCIRAALFDFDGTLSLIREGWQHVMVDMMVGILLATPGAESEQELRRVVTGYVTELTGQQTAYQMLRLCEEVRERGGTPASPIQYKRDYLRRLWLRIGGRVAALESGEVAQECFLVTGARAMLTEMCRRGAELHLASGTDQPDVEREARALGLIEFFVPRIHGALDEYWKFSKEQLIQEIATEQGLRGYEFAGIGDGPDEIANTRRVGGIAVGVASDETERGRTDELKRARLIEAGADLVVTDFAEAERIAAYLWGETDAA